MKTKTPQLVQLNVRIDKDLYKELKIFCLQRDFRLEETVPIAITEYMVNAQKKTKGNNSKSKSLI